MADEGAVGRELLLKKNSIALVGLTNVSVDWNGTPVDVTSGENNGFRCLIDAVGSQTLDISGEAFTKDNIIKDIVLNPNTSKLLTDIEIEWPIFESGNSQPATLTGNFFLATRGEAAPQGEGITFSFSLQSGNEWVYTAEAV
jgi:predicted secreted protein